MITSSSLSLSSVKNEKVKRRFCRGIFNSCTHSMEPDELEEDDEREIDNKNVAVNEIRGRQRAQQGAFSHVAFSQAAASSLPASPILTVDRTGAERLSKKGKIWRSLKKLNFRSQQRHNSDDHRVIAENGNGQNFMSAAGSYPNLSSAEVARESNSGRKLSVQLKNRHSQNSATNSFSPAHCPSAAARVGQYLFSRKKHKKSANQDQFSHEEQRVITNDTSGSILVRSANGIQRNSSNRVEFASSDFVIPLEELSANKTISHATEDRRSSSDTPPSCVSSSISTQAQTVVMTSPVKSLLNRMANQHHHKSVERQTTFESTTSSCAADDLLKQELCSNPEGDSPPPVTCYMLNVNLKEGRDLVIRDASGSSDPYVKFKYKQKLIYKSATINKNLNPQWNETFYHVIDDPSAPLDVEVFDYDRFASDDFMGAASLDLSHLEAKKPQDLKIMLREDDSDQYMGYLMLQISLSPLTQEEHQQLMRKSARNSTETSGGVAAAVGSLKRVQKNSQIWTSVVNVVLVEAKNLLPTDTHTSAALPDPYVKFKLGIEKYKSKPTTKTLEPRWLEQFDLHIYDEHNQILEVMVHDKRKDIFMGRCAIDLSTLAKEDTHQKWYELEDGAGQIFLLLTISGTVGVGTVSDLNDTSSVSPISMTQKYELTKTLENMKDVGHLTVKVFRAQNLASADFGGKSDPFCVLELVNARLQTHTEYKTLDPEWNKVFTFNVKDIHSALEVTVYDEDPNKKVEFLGKVSIPLLKIRNGEKRWYALKDRKLRRRAKGQVLIELDVVWNPIRASIRTFNPKEEKYMAHELRFKRQVFMRNVTRVKHFVMSAVDVGAFVQSLFSWDSTLRSLLAFIVYMVIVYFFELYMMPLVLLLLFVKSYVYRAVVAGLGSKEETDIYFDSDEDDEETIDDKSASASSPKPEEKKSFKERIQAIQDTLAMVQNTLDYMASTMERMKNTFNFTQPFLSTLAIVILCAGTIVLYLIPLRWLAMLWGINKFTKKLRNPNFVPNNELLDFLSRVPSDDEIRQYGEFRPEPVVENPSAANSQASRNKKPTRA